MRLLQRSDESIRLQTELFTQTNDALQHIKASTGVTQKKQLKTFYLQDVQATSQNKLPKLRVMRQSQEKSSRKSPGGSHKKVQDYPVLSRKKNQRRRRKNEKLKEDAS